MLHYTVYSLSGKLFLREDGEISSEGNPLKYNKIGDAMKAASILNKQCGTTTFKIISSNN